MARLRFLAFALALGASAALAADYPFSGYFTSQDTDFPPEHAQLACAFGFFQQNADGSFTNHIIDIDRYRADKTLRYQKYGAGQCTIEGKVETCTMTASVDKDEIGQSYYDVMGTQAADWVKIAMFDTLDEAKRFARTGRGTPTVEFRLSRCIGFDAAKLAPYLTDETTTLGPDQRGELLTPEMNAASRPLMEDILARIGKSR